MSRPKDKVGPADDKSHAQPRAPAKRAWRTQTIAESAGRTQTIAESAGRMTRDIFARQGFAQAEVITRWRDIVGPALAMHSFPDKLTFAKGQPGGTLHILAESAFALELQHLAPQVVERINGYFGFPAVARITLRQAPMSILYQRQRRRRSVVAHNPRARAEAAETVAAVGDTNLRQALQALGELVIADKE